MTYALRYVYGRDNRRVGEYVPARAPFDHRTPDRARAKTYVKLERAYTRGYEPQWNEIVRFCDDGTVEVVESRYRQVTQFGDHHVPYSTPN